MSGPHFRKALLICGASGRDKSEVGRPPVRHYGIPIVEALQAVTTSEQPFLHPWCIRPEAARLPSDGIADL